MRNSASYIRIIAFAVIAYLFLNYLGKTADQNAFEAIPWLWALYVSIVLFHIVAEVCVGALHAVLFNTLSPEKQEAYLASEAMRKENQFKWFKDKYKQLLGSTPMEEEQEIILDHNYDGIQELDNKLPPWWVYGFYATIIFGVLYMVRFHVIKDYNQDQEYEMAVVQANREIEAWKKTAKDLVDINTVTLLTEAADLKAGKVIFTNNCVACHAADGGGGIGPNLTDEHWILGGGIKNVFKTISEGGRDGKGMIAWKKDLKPLEMAQVASYVLTFQGTTPANGKEQEGDLWSDPDAPSPAQNKVNQASGTPAPDLENGPN